MNRPAQRNAFHPGLIAELRHAFAEAASASGVRAAVLAGRGGAFSAGADLGWMREAASYTDDENLADAAGLASMLDCIQACPRPVIARVQGAVVGGGVGLVAASDIAVASEDAWFQLSEVRLGLIPAVISPYVIEALGPRRARQLMLTAERVSARQAAAWSLVHEAVAVEALDERIDEIARLIATGGPDALASAKDLTRAVRGRPFDSSLRDETSQRIARIRASEEAQEGIAAFFDRRAPRWAEE